MSQTQRAWIVHRRGPPKSALALHDDWPMPSKLLPGETLVRIQAAALNPIGYKLMKFLPNMIQRTRPLPPEHDFSGEIVDGNGTEFKKGDQVFGYISLELARSIGQGALAQYARVPATHLAIRPSNVTPVEAAGVILCAQTAYQALVDEAGIESGQTILINGGSSALGVFAIQLAKARGAKVIATASGKNEAFVLSQGADEFIDYTKAPLHEYLASNPPSPKFHVIFDAVGLVDPSLYIKSPAYLAPDGVFISSGLLPDSLKFSQIWRIVKTYYTNVLQPTWLGGTNRRFQMVMIKNKKSTVDAIQKMLADGSLKPIVDSTFEFDDALKAYDRLLTSRATGKVVIKVDPTVN